MPPLSRWFVKTSLFFLVLALAAVMVMAFRPVLGLRLISGLFPVSIHLIVVGWLTQLIFGVAFWMFPKYSQERPRGNEVLGWWTYALLNLGLLLRVLGEPLSAYWPGNTIGWMLVLSATLQFLAGLGFVLNTWARVKEK